MVTLLLVLVGALALAVLILAGLLARVFRMLHRLDEDLGLDELQISALDVKVRNLLQGWP